MSEYLAHYGVKGQKWGVRRYQNKDGTRTQQGRARRSERKSIGQMFIEEMMSKPYKQSRSVSKWPPTEIGDAMLSRWPKTEQNAWKTAYQKSQIAMQRGDKKLANKWAQTANDIVVKQQTAQFYGRSYSDVLASYAR